MTDSIQELDEILMTFLFNGYGQDAEVYIPASDEAKQAILDWHNKQIEEVLDSLKGQQIPVAALRNDTNEFEQIQAIPISAIEAERNKLKESK